MYLFEESTEENLLYEDENSQEFYEEITDKTSSFDKDLSEESVEENLLYENENLQEFNKKIANKALDFNEISQNTA